MTIASMLALALFDMSALRAARVVLVLYAVYLGASPLTVGLLAATFSVFPVVLSWPVGKLNDRYGSRWLLMSGALCGGLGMLAPYFVTGMIAIFVAAAANGLAMAVYNVSLQNVVGTLSRPENRTRSFSNYSLTNSTASFIGPLVAGFSIEHMGYGNACLPLVIAALLPAIVLTLRGATLPGGSGSTRQSNTRIRDMLATRKVSKMLITSSLLQSGLDLFQFYLPVYTHGVGLSASATGIVLAMNSAAAFVVRSILPRMIKRYKEERVLEIAFYVSAVSFGLLPFFENGVILGLISFVFGLGMGVGQPVVTMQMFSNSAKGRSGETLGLRMTVNHLTRLIGPVVFGFVSSAVGLSAVFWINGLMLGGGGYASRPGAADSTEQKP